MTPSIVSFIWGSMIGGARINCSTRLVKQFIGAQRCPQGSWKLSCGLNSSNHPLHRLLMWLIKEEERQDCLEANTNVHIQQVVRKMELVNANIEKLVKKSDNCKVEIQHLGKEQEVQEAQSSHLEEKLKAMEDLMEDQAMKIIGMEEITVLRSRKACMCGERIVTTSGSGSCDNFDPFSPPSPRCSYPITPKTDQLQPTFLYLIFLTWLSYQRRTRR